MQKLKEKQEKFIGNVPKKYQLVERFCKYPEKSKINNKGITLIALIITIIVMLILVGVTINVALNGNLLKKAQMATSQTEEQAILEEMVAMMEINDNGNFKHDDIIDNMKANHPDYKIEYSYPNATITGKLGTYNYIVSETEIKIGKLDVDEAFEKYIMGEDKKGRLLPDIVDTDNNAFIDDPLTEDVNETETLGVEFLIAGQNEDYTKGFVYVKYNNKAYKITCNMSEAKSEELEMIYEPKGREGQTTAEGWTILYDNETTVEAVSPTAMGNLRLGYSPTATDETTQLEESINSYNNAITIINDYCKTLEGLPTNSEVRSVGASVETTVDTYSSDNLATWNSEYNGVGLIGDTNFEQDLVRMAYWGEVGVGVDYWVASRVIREDSYSADFNAMYVGADNTITYIPLWNILSSGSWDCNSLSYGVRPIIRINSI